MEKVKGKIVLYSYALIIGSALAFDIMGDRSFGALMLASLPIAVISLLCLLIGPWLRREWRITAIINWVSGAVFVLLITVFFVNLGIEQGKTGELVFTYAALIMTFPSSIIFPLIANSTEALLNNSVALRVGFAWLTCMLAGAIEWWLIVLLRNTIERWRTASK